MPTHDDQTRLIERLSPGQLDVIERVALLMSSKEIARELGISHNTVDQRIKRIQSILNVRTRADAARMYLANQGSRSERASELCGKLVHQFSELPESEKSFHQQPSPSEWNPVGGGNDQMLRQPQAAYFAHGMEQQKSTPWYSVLLEARPSNELSSSARTVVILVLMTLSVITAGAVVSIAEGLSRLI